MKQCLNPVFSEVKASTDFRWEFVTAENKRVTFVSGESLWNILHCNYSESKNNNYKCILPALIMQ